MISRGLICCVVCSQKSEQVPLTPTLTPLKVLRYNDLTFGEQIGCLIMPTVWKTAIVVGASSGIGEEITRQLVAQGCTVAIVARRLQELERIAQSLNTGQSAKVLLFPHDVCVYDEVPALFQKITHELGGLDVIIYAAGVMPSVQPSEYAFAKDRQMIEVNLLGAVAWLNEAAQRFERTKAGTIVGISSVAGERGRYPQPVYCTSKAALNAYLEALRNRLGRYGVKVVTIKPGPVATPMTEGLGKLPLLIPVERAAREIIQSAQRGKANVFIPGTWRWIFLIIRNIPSFVFQKLKF